MAGRSACDGCGAALRWWELAPIVGHLALGGRCARCGGRIDRTHLAVELCGAGVGGAALLVAPGWPGLAGACLGWTLLALALLDLRHFWLPDRLTLPLAAAGLVAGGGGWSERLIGAAAGYLALRLVASAYRAARGRTGLGAGDAKLLAAIGAWLGWHALPQVVLLASVTGLGWALVLRRRGAAVGATTRLPFGTLLALAAWALWLASV